MRLYPAFSPAARLALSIYYRFECAGGRIPPEGPLLLVANHPNSLLDPAAVCAVARRPVRFLAKAPLFEQPGIGALVRSCGAIPVHRRQDDPSLMHRNEDAFRAAHEALLDGDAVGIFPEGLSHDKPSLAPLRTGAARIALGAAGLLGSAFPIVPVGLVLPRKDRFRSPALCLVGRPLGWEDLADAGPDDVGAVRELTRRIEAGLREVTLDLERWEDATVVTTAEAIYAAERELPEDPGRRVARLGQVSRALTRLRREDPVGAEDAYAAVRRFGELLAALELEPGELRDRTPRAGSVLRWILGRAGLFLLAVPLVAAAGLVFFVPYRLTGALARSSGVKHDVLSTYKLLVGVLLYGGWIALIAAVVAWVGSLAAGLLALVGLPALGLVALGLRDRAREAVAEGRAWLLLRGRGSLRRRLLRRRGELGARLEGLRLELLGRGREP